MSNYLEQLESQVSSTDWERMAKHADAHPEELKAHVIEALQNTDFWERPEPVLSELRKADSCLSQDFEVSLYKIIGVSGTVKLCFNNISDWSLDLTLNLVVAGAVVWTTHYTFNPHNLGVCFHPSVGVAKATLCVGIKVHSNKICLNLSGEACVWAAWWRCEKFDLSLLCIPI